MVHWQHFKLNLLKISGTFSFRLHSKTYNLLVKRISKPLSRFLHPFRWKLKINNFLPWSFQVLEIRHELHRRTWYGMPYHPVSVQAFSILSGLRLSWCYLSVDQPKFNRNQLKFNLKDMGRARNKTHGGIVEDVCWNVWGGSLGPH